MSRKNVPVAVSTWGLKLGMSRAVRVGDRVISAGTAAVQADGAIDPDAARQTRYCFEKVMAAFQELGAGPEHVVRTRMYLVDPADFDACAAVHNEFFGAVHPANTTIQTGLMLPGWKVEVEVEAFVE
jgi:enamine deaminase RidA (YjgF/YER057c/UK114 family)